MFLMATVWVRMRAEGSVLELAFELAQARAQPRHRELALAMEKGMAYEWAQVGALY